MYSLNERSYGLKEWIGSRNTFFLRKEPVLRKSPFPEGKGRIRRAAGGLVLIPLAAMLGAAYERVVRKNLSAQLRQSNFISVPNE